MKNQIRFFLKKALEENKPSGERLELLKSIASKLKDYKSKGDKLPGIVFVCTHNSRRSQFSQVWAHVIQHDLLGGKPGFEIHSAGTEETACNPRTIASLERAGFDAAVTEVSENPVYHCLFGKADEGLKLWSKTLDDPSIKRPVIAVMTCSHADENCPFVPGAEARFSLTYQDPKESDDTDAEEETYDERSGLIASELHFIFSAVHG